MFVVICIFYLLYSLVCNEELVIVLNGGEMMRLVADCFFFFSDSNFMFYGRMNLFSHS